MKKLVYLLVSLSIFLFASCENFMQGSGIKDQLEDMILEANAKSIKIIISQDNTMGTFLSTGEKECKLGYAIDVQFNLKKESYIYKGLKAVSTTDETESRDEYVEFTALENDDQKGIYKVSIKVLKEASDIMIVPDCILIPGVVKDECRPVYSDAGCEQDSTIVLAFNKPVSPTNDFTLSITDSSGNSLSEYFTDSYFSSDGTVLYIPTNKEKNLLDPQDQINNRDIFVKIDLINIVDEEGNSGKSIFQYKYRVNKQKDSVKPVLDDVRVYSTNDTSSKYYKQIFSKNYTMWVDGGPESFGNGESVDYTANHVGGSIYIELEGTDIGAGIGNVLVKEKLLTNTSGTEQTYSAVSYHSPVFTNQDTGLIYCTYSFNTPSDGILEIEIFAEDYSNNISTASKKFWVIKDTLIDSFSISFLEELEENPGGDEYQVNSWRTTMIKKIPVVTDKNQEVSLMLNETPENDGKRNSKDYYYQMYYDDYKISVYWGESEDTIQTPVNKNSQNKYVFTRDVNKYVFIKLICEDGVGNVKEIIKRMAPRAEISPSDEGEYDIANFYALLNKSNIPFPDPGAGKAPQKYCNFIYEFTSTDENHPLTFTAFKSADNNMFGIFSFQDEIRNVFDHIKALKLEENSNITDADIYLSGDLKIYISTTVGDFPSPRSNNYLSTTINEWTNAPDPSSTEIPPQTILVPQYGEFKLSSTSTSQSINMEYNKYGPANKNYIPTGTPLKITVTPIKSQGSCKINVENYKTQAGINDGIIYTIHAIAINAKSPDFPEYSAQYSASSKSSELTLTANLIYKFYIEAYDPANNTSYIPLPYIFLEGPDMGAVNIRNPGFELLIEYNNDTQEEVIKDPDELEYHIIPDNQTTDPTEPVDQLILRKDLTPPRVEAEVVEVTSQGYLSISNYDIISNLGNAASLYIYLSDPMSDYSGGSSMDPGSYPDPFESFKKNKRGNVVLSYYIIPNPSTNIKKLPSYSVNELKTVYSSFEKKIEISPENNQVYIPFGNIEEGSYTISFVPEDKYNNTAVYTFPFINRTFGYMDYVFAGEEYKTFIHQADSDPETYTYYELIVEGQMISDLTDPANITLKMDKLQGDLSSLAWSNMTTLCNTLQEIKFEPEDITDSNGDVIGQRGYAKIATDNTNQWRRLRPYRGFNAYNSSVWNTGFYYNDYIFVGEDSTCTAKNCIDGLNGLQIISDNSVFVHTMYSNEKLTESRTVENAAAIWETRGLETGMVTFTHPGNGSTLNKTYELKNLNKVPSGYYYTTIAHFADGTSVMTDIKQKD